MCAIFQADKLLSQDFKGMLDGIIEHLPRDRQIMLYSATFPLTVESFMVRFSYNTTTDSEFLYYFTLKSYLYIIFFF